MVQAKGTFGILPVVGITVKQIPSSGMRVREKTFIDRSAFKNQF